MNYLHIIPHDIYIHIYKYVYGDCMKEIVSSFNDKRNNKFKDRFVQIILNDDIRVYYTTLEIFNVVSLGITSSSVATTATAATAATATTTAINMYYDDNGMDILDEELYYLSAITEFNFRNHHFNILTTELPDNLKEATCIRLRLSNIDILLGFDDPNDTNDMIYAPLYYLFNDFITTWLELVYYTNILLNEYLLIHNLATNGALFSLYRFDTVIENGYVVIVPIFEDNI